MLMFYKMKQLMAILLLLLFGSYGCGFNQRKKEYLNNRAKYSRTEDSMMTLFYCEHRMAMSDYQFVDKSDQKITFQTNDTGSKIYEYESLDHIENYRIKELLISMEKFGVNGFSQQFKHVGVPLYIWSKYRRVYIKGNVTNYIWLNFFNSTEARRIDSIIYASDEPFTR